MKWLIIICFCALLFGCVDSIENRNFTVEKIQSGNLIVLRNGMVIKLIGVADNEACRTYLEENIRGKLVTLKFDKRHYVRKYHKGEIIPAYVTVNDPPLSLNGYILSTQISTVEESSLEDSIVRFRAYANGGKLNSRNYEEKK